MMEYYSSLKKKEILPFATIWMDLEGTVLSEISQTRQILHVESKKKSQTHRNRD